MEKDFNFAELYEIYKGLLTAKQREMFESYFYFDLSLSEIAEGDGSSRQSVFDAIKKVKEKLIEYESILGLREKNGALLKIADSTNDKEIAGKIKEIIGK